MKLLYAGGDSWTEGNEIPHTPSHSEKYYNTWPWFLSQRLNIPMCINDGLGAGSNSRIHRKTCNFVFDWIGKGKDPADLMVVIGWTTPERTELLTNGSYYRITPQTVLGDNLQDDIATQYRDIYIRSYDEDQRKNETLDLMLNLRMLCQGVGVKYYDFVAIGYRPYVYKKIAQDRYNLIIDNMYDESWNDYVTRNHHQRYTHRHPTIETHGLWADELARAIP